MGEKKQKALTKEDILTRCTMPEETLEVEAWGGTVKVRGITKQDELRIRKEARTPDGEVDLERFEYMMFITGVKEPEFVESDIEQLQNLESAAFNVVVGRIMELSGFTSEEQERQAAKLFRA